MPEMHNEGSPAELFRRWLICSAERLSPEGFSKSPRRQQDK